MNKNVTAIDFSSSGIRVVTGYCFRNKVYVRQALEGLPLKVDEHGQIDIDDASNSLLILLNNLKKTINDDIGLIVPIFPAEFCTKSNPLLPNVLIPFHRPPRKLLILLVIRIILIINKNK